MEVNLETLTLTQVARVVDTALAAARRCGVSPIALVVLDQAGQLKYSVREDGASLLRLNIAHGKAAAAFGMGVSSRTLHERASANPVFFNAIASACGEGFIAQAGAVVIVGENSDPIGAIGASGGSGDEDEAVCMEGVQGAGLKYR